MLALLRFVFSTSQQKILNPLPLSRYSTLKMEDRYPNILFYDCFIKDFGQR